MSGPFSKTLSVLSTSGFPEAIDLLVMALESSQETVSLAGAHGLLKRTGLQGQREVLLRFNRLPIPVQMDLQAQSLKFDALLRQQLIQGTVEQRQEALQGIRLLHASEQIPSLVQLMYRADLPDMESVVQCLQDLVALLDEDMRSSSITDASRAGLVARREKALSHLEQALLRYEALAAKDTVIESILILGTTQHTAVKKVLWQGTPECRDRAGRMLLTSRHPKVMRQILEAMKQQYPHPKAFEAVRTRTDIEFISELLRAVSTKSSTLFEQNLKQIDRLAWLEADEPPFGLIPPVLQPALLTLVFGTKVPEEHKLKTQDWLLRNGGPAGRIAAAEKAALLDENVLQDVLVNSLDAEDEHVQAWAVGQLRQHAVPETFVLLLERLDSPSAEVRAAVRNELSDFNVERVLGLIDNLDATASERVGELLRKIDDQAAAKLERELRSAIRPKRIRAAKAVVKLGFQEQMKKPLLALATDSDFMIRRTAAEVLELVVDPEILPALDRLARDPHARVREAAVKALSTWQQQSAQQLDPVLMQQRHFTSKAENMLQDLTLLAAGNPLGSVSGYFSQGTSLREVLIFVLFAFVIVAIWAALFFWDRLRKMSNGELVPATSVFEELCRAHQLSQQDIALLVDASQECQLSSPAPLFVQPELLQMLSIESQPKANIYRQLHEQLFGGL